MKNLNRDLMVITKSKKFNEQELEQTIIALSPILDTVENFTAICSATEVFDLNQYKLHTKFKKVAKYIRFSYSKPFVFFNNKN